MLYFVQAALIPLAIVAFAWIVACSSSDSEGLPSPPRARQRGYGSEAAQVPARILWMPPDTAKH
jgi:hypothetical protein